MKVKVEDSWGRQSLLTSDFHWYTHTRTRAPTHTHARTQACTRIVPYLLQSPAVIELVANLSVYSLWPDEERGKEGTFLQYRVGVRSELKLEKWTAIPLETQRVASENNSKVNCPSVQTPVYTL